LYLCPGQHRVKLRLRLKKTAAKGKKEEGESGALGAGCLTPSADEIAGLFFSYLRG